MGWKRNEDGQALLVHVDYSFCLVACSDGKSHQIFSQPHKTLRKRPDQRLHTRRCGAEGL